MPFDPEVKAAQQVLATSPVRGETGFTAVEVADLGAYLARSGAGTREWYCIYSGEPEAWPVAVHERAELLALKAMGYDPESAQTPAAVFHAAHREAVEQEISFLIKWAEQIGIIVPPSAVEATNPLRNFGRSPYNVMETCRREFGWQPASPDELNQARQFWSGILKERP